MTRVRVVDYIANPGGGCRFVSEILRGFRKITDAEFEVVSHGLAFNRYTRVLAGEFPVHDLPPENAFRASPPWDGKPGASVLNAFLRLPDFHFDVPADVYEGCDLVWFPWMHRHRVAEHQPDRTFATFHDCISIEFPGVLRERFRRDEIRTTTAWLQSSAGILVTSRATAATMGRLFHPPAPSRTWCRSRRSTIVRLHPRSRGPGHSATGPISCARPTSAHTRISRRCWKGSPRGERRSRS